MGWATGRTIGFLIAFRALQGVAGALLTPASLAVIVATFREEERAPAIGTWTAFGAVAGVIGCLGAMEIIKVLTGLGQPLENEMLVGDLTESTMVHFFAERFPERFIEVGIAEQNMCNIAAGLAAMGKIPFFATYGAFATCRAADQLRVTVAYTNLNVKIGGAHGGISVGPDGATHQAMEEISIIRSIPHMKMVVPADYWESYKATKAAAAVEGPVSALCPGSILQHHATVTIVVDEAAASRLQLAEYYRYVFEHKPEWQRIAVPAAS